MLYVKRIVANSPTTHSSIPKCTLPNNPQPITIGGKRCLVPGDALVQLITPAVHRNPRVWPAAPAADNHPPASPPGKRHNDLEEFKPERWILDTEAKRAAARETYESVAADADTDEAAAPGVDPHPDPAAGLYKPPKGAYIPFSEGHRSCVGRHFAQVELMAVLALIFAQYSVELAVDEWATDAELGTMDARRKREVWDQAREKVERQLRDDMGAVLTMKLRRGFVGLRLVRRGGERFDWGGITEEEIRRVVSRLHESAVFGSR